MLNLVLFDYQGVDDIKHPTLFALSEDYFSSLPDDFTSASCVIQNPDDLYYYLFISFSVWAKYRDQIIGRKTMIENSKINDIRFLFDIITASI